MGADTAIAWTDHTFNPWWGCERVSPGCQHCYAEAFAKRTGNAVWGKQALRRFFGDKHWSAPLKWDRAAEKAGRPALVFCASMADVFEDRADLASERARLFDVIAETPHLIWQLLTKRPENVRRLVEDAQFAIGGHSWLHEVDGGDPGWPRNVWIGTTVEDQQRADERMSHLADIPAPVRFLSCEPLLGPVNLERWLITGPSTTPPSGRLWIDWVICGGESGPGHRPLDVDHARSLRDQCDLCGVPFFFKQHGGRTPTAGGDVLDGRQHKAFPPEAHR